MERRIANVGYVSYVLVCYSFAVLWNVLLMNDEVDRSLHTPFVRGNLSSKLSTTLASSLIPPPVLATSEVSLHLVAHL